MLLNDVNIKDTNIERIFTIINPKVTCFSLHFTFKDIKPYITNLFKNIVIDLKYIQQWDSTLLSILLNISNTLNKENKKLTIQNCPTDFKRIMDICGASTFFIF